LSKQYLTKSIYVTLACPITTGTIGNGQLVGVHDREGLHASGAITIGWVMPESSLHMQAEQARGSRAMRESWLAGPEILLRG
jgi:hypothetical protein